MYRLLLCLLLLISVSPTWCDRWAVLIAGSRGYEFYRHQSCAYRVRYFLKRNNVDISNVYMFANRPAYSSRNKAHYGKLYNKPRGPEVYGGVRPDYEGNDKTVQNLENALLGKKETGGRYLASTNQDYVFIYYAGWGGQGVVRFGEYDPGANLTHHPKFMYRDEFQSIIEEMANRKLFKYLFIFFESYGAESMLKWLDEKRIPHVYAIGASSVSGRSFARYCPSIFTDFPMPGIANTCLSMRATSAFFESAERLDLRKVNIGYLFDWVQQQTLQLKPPQQITQHGDMSVRNVAPVDFFGNNPKRPKGKYKALTLNDKYLQKMYESSEAWSDFNHEEMSLRFVLERSMKSGGRGLARGKKELEALKKFLKELSEKVTSIVSDLYDEKERAKVLKEYTYGETDFNCFRKTFNELVKCMDDFHSHALMHAHVFYKMCSQKNVDEIMNAIRKQQCN